METVCKECNIKPPKIVEDHSTGDRICAYCGLVCEERVIDEHTEWRTFSNEAPKNDPNRVGGPMSELLPDMGLSTVIAGKLDGDREGLASNSANTLARLQQRNTMSNSDRQLVNAYKEISLQVDQLSAPGMIKTNANKIYHDVHVLGAMKAHVEGCVAAAVYIACRLHGIPRSFKEVCAVSRVSKKEIGKCYKYMVRALDLTKMDTVSTDDFMNRFCSNLDLSMEVTKAAMHVTREASRLGIVAGKSPISIASAGIFLVSQFSGCPRTTKEISEVTGISDATIRNAYKDLYPYRQQLIPQNYSTTVPLDSPNTPF
eukprot:GCRY01003562.1.p1 GENE.GCRY01003562.1~~GCRY01003562.1.p1  ORF type:complete len:315 (-),score=35.42 GCRY01003562.1:196-1140(-)